MASPVSPHTHKSTVLAKAIEQKLVDNMGTLGLLDVLYGDQLMLPKSPAAVVTPGVKNRPLMGVSAPGGRVENRMTVFIDVLSQDALSSEADARLQLQQLAEDVEDTLHEDVTMGGIIIHGYVNIWDPGTTFIQASKFRTVRMTYIGISKTYLSA